MKHKASSPTARAKTIGTTRPTGGTVVPPTGGATFLGGPLSGRARGDTQDPLPTPPRRNFSGDSSRVLVLEARVLRLGDLEAFFREVLDRPLQPAPPMILTRDDVRHLQRPFKA